MGRSSSLDMVPFKSLSAVSYSTFIVTMAVSCIISQIKRVIGRKSCFFVRPGSAVVSHSLQCAWPVLPSGSGGLSSTPGSGGLSVHAGQLSAYSGKGQSSRLRLRLRL